MKTDQITKDKKSGATGKVVIPKDLHGDKLKKWLQQYFYHNLTIDPITKEPSIPKFVASRLEFENKNLKNTEPSYNSQIYSAQSAAIEEWKKGKVYQTRQNAERYAENQKNNEAWSQIGKGFAQHYTSGINGAVNVVKAAGHVMAQDYKNVPGDMAKAFSKTGEFFAGFKNRAQGIKKLFTPVSEQEISKKEDDIMKKQAYKNKQNKILFNHPDWYTRIPEYITSNLNWGVRKEGQYFPVAYGARVPVNLVIPQKNGVVSQAYKDSMNAIFIKLRGSNSGAFNYDVEDVAAYIECVRSIRALYCTLARNLSCLNNVDPYITRSPDALLSLIGYNAAQITDMKLNRASYVSELCRLADYIETTFPLPPQMTVFARDQYLATAILEEGKGPKSSVYAYYIRSGIQAAGNSSDLAQADNAPALFSAQLNKLEGMINSARTYISASYPNRDTFAKISGDCLKAYGQAGFSYPLPRISLSDKAAVAFDEYLLHQLQNATIGCVANEETQTSGNNPAFSITYEMDINIGDDNSGSIPTNAIQGVEGTGAPLKPIVVNTNKKDISGGEAISLTRNVTTFKIDSATYTTESTETAAVQNCDTSVLGKLTVQCYDVNNNLQRFSITSFVGLIGRSDMWAQLDYYPALQIISNNYSGEYTELIDLDTYAFMTEDQIKQFNDTATLSMYKTVDVSDQVNFRAVKR